MGYVPLQQTPQWYLSAPRTQAPMLLHQNPNWKGTLLKNNIGSPFNFKPGTAVNRTTAKKVKQIYFYPFTSQIIDEWCLSEVETLEGN